MGCTKYTPVLLKFCSLPSGKYKSQNRNKVKYVEANCKDGTFLFNSSTNLKPPNTQYYPLCPTFYTFIQKKEGYKL